MAFRQVRQVTDAGTKSQALVSSVSGAYAADDLGLSMYQDPPDAEMSVREFEEMTKDRLKLLHAFDRVCGYDTQLGAIPDLRNKLMKELTETNLLLGYPTAANRDSFPQQKADFQRRDATSHYALRLAFCKTRDSKDWLIRQEQRLFVLRYDALTPEAQEAYLKTSGVKCKKFEPADPKEIDRLHKFTPGAKIWKGDGKPDFDRNFYEMPFSEVHPGLIAKRQVLIKAGVAYVPSSALKLILAGKFKERLQNALEIAFTGLPTALANPSVGGFLRLLQEHGMQLCVAKSSSGDDPGEKLTLENFEQLMVRSFPPCMRRLVEKQRDSKKHLKHAGRLQLRPFLKDCGFTIEESMRWWRQELCKDSEIDATVFEKNYTYDIEHTYGKKGHFQGQNSFGCPKIIGFPGEANGQFHGCPFKQLDTPSLRQMLHRWKVSESAANEIDKLVNHGKHFQLACMEYFKATHPGHEGEGVGNSPGDFYKESCRCHAKKAQKAADKAAGGSSKSG